MKPLRLSTLTVSLALITAAASAQQQMQISGAYKMIALTDSNSDSNLIDDVTTIQAWVETGSQSDVILSQVHLRDGSNVNVNEIKNVTIDPLKYRGKDGIRIYLEVAEPLSNHKISGYRLQIGLMQKGANEIGDPQKLSLK